MKEPGHLAPPKILGLFTQGRKQEAILAAIFIALHISFRIPGVFYPDQVHLSFDGQLSMVEEYICCL